MGVREKDPLGKGQHESGAKLDAGKIRPWLVLGGFSKALEEVSRVGTYGAAKYTDDGWRGVPDGFRRYSEAMLRHQLKEMSREKWDRESNLLHAAHVAWNALARLELILEDERRVDGVVRRLSDSDLQKLSKAVRNGKVPRGTSTPSTKKNNRKIK